jgi:hypothetical protein
MSSSPGRIRAYVLKTPVDKLRPARFPGMPPVLAALVGFVSLVQRLRSAGTTNHRLPSLLDPRADDEVTA